MYSFKAGLQEMKTHRGFWAALYGPYCIACSEANRQSIWMVVPVQLNPLPNTPYHFLAIPHGQHQAAKSARSFLDGPNATELYT